MGSNPNIGSEYVEVLAGIRKLFSGVNSYAGFLSNARKNLQWNRMFLKTKLINCGYFAVEKHSMIPVI